VIEEDDDIRYTHKRAQRVPSPPNLFKEYAMYQKTAPEFLKKYANQVASGGRETGEKKVAVKIRQKTDKPVRKAAFK
jgi:hypothetical protein